MDKCNCRFNKKGYCVYYDEDCECVGKSDCIKAYSSKDEILDLSFAAIGTTKNKEKNNYLPDQSYLDSIPCYEIRHEMIDLYVYSGYLRSSAVEDCTISILDFYRTVRHRIFVSKSWDGRFYIANQVLQVYLNRKYTFYAKLKYASYKECTEPIGIGELAVASPLKLYGYAVGKQGQSVERRHEVIRFILDHEILRVTDIINLLQFNIINGEASNQNKQKAIAEWRQDIKWIVDEFGK